MGEVVYKNLSYRIVGLLFEVYNELGPGYKKIIYERAFEKSLRDNNIKYKRQVGYKTVFKDEVIGISYLDILIDDKIVIELKKGDYFLPNNIKQVATYLKATNLKLGILVNFTSNGVKFKRILNL